MNKYNQNIFNVLDDSLNDLNKIYEKMTIYAVLFKSNENHNLIKIKIKEMKMCEFDKELSNLSRIDSDKKETNDFDFDHRDSKIINS
jgi:hypothetical protein